MDGRRRFASARRQDESLRAIQERSACRPMGGHVICALLRGLVTIGALLSTTSNGC